MAGTPIGRVKLTKDGQKYSVVTVWKNDMGGYSLSIDRDRPGYPAMDPISALKAWVGGGYLDYWPERPREERERPAQRERGGSRRANTPPPDDFDDPDIPF